MFKRRKEKPAVVSTMDNRKLGPEPAQQTLTAEQTLTSILSSFSEEKFIDVRDRKSFLKRHLRGAVHCASIEQFQERSCELPSARAGPLNFFGYQQDLDPLRAYLETKQRMKFIYKIKHELCLTTADSKQQFSPENQNENDKSENRHCYSAEDMVWPLAEKLGLLESGPSEPRLWNPSPALEGCIGTVESSLQLFSHIQRQPVYTTDDLKSLNPPSSPSSPSAAPTTQHRPATTTPPVAVDLGCSQGRDVIYLAQRGWQVIGIDNQPKLLKKCLKFATRANMISRVTNSYIHYMYTHIIPTLIST